MKHKSSSERQTGLLYSTTGLHDPMIANLQLLRTVLCSRNRTSTTISLSKTIASMERCRHGVCGICRFDNVTEFASNSFLSNEPVLQKNSSFLEFYFLILLIIKRKFLKHMILKRMDVSNILTTFIGHWHWRGLSQSAVIIVMTLKLRDYIWVYL